MSSETAAPTLFFTDQDVNVFASMPVLPDQDPFLFHNPTKELQERFVGQSFEPTYREAANFLNYLYRHAFQDRLPERVLDFGCGWGRMLRLLRYKPELKDVELHGCDVNKDSMEPVRRSVPYVYLQPCKRISPSPYVDRWFDVIYAYSVFSHLSEESHRDWAKDFARIIKPGGRVVLTTQGLKLLEMCKNYREGIVPKTHLWHEYLAASFVEPATRSMSSRSWSAATVSSAIRSKLQCKMCEARL